MSRQTAEKITVTLFFLHSVWRVHWQLQQKPHYSPSAPPGSVPADRAKFHSEYTPACWDRGWVMDFSFKHRCRVNRILSEVTFVNMSCISRWSRMFASEDALFLNWWSDLCCCFATAWPRLSVSGRRKLPHCYRMLMGWINPVSPKIADDNDDD